MPYISVVTPHKLSAEQKEGIKSGFGRLISIIPGKIEKNLTICFSDGHTIYKAGEKAEACAFVEVRLLGKFEFEVKKEFGQAVFKMLGETAGVAPDMVTLNILEFMEWGSAENYRQV